MQITYDEGHFDSFPMFSYSGKQLIWGSSRNGQTEYDLNLFIADWVDDQGSGPASAASLSLASLVALLVPLTAALIMFGGS